MAVYTAVSDDQASALLDTLNLGAFQSLTGIQGGIENTNYFLTTDQGDYVLTLFERLSETELPYYLNLMLWLAQHGVPVPAPHPNAQGHILLSVAGKPAAIVDRLPGKPQLAPQAVHCQQMGEWLARMHLAGEGFEGFQPNLRGLPWWNETAPVVLPHLSDDQRRLLQQELAFQNHLATSAWHQALPRGPVHADVFRDNVMFDGEVLCGVFDFYFAGHDAWLFDLCVCLNDWCIDLDTGAWDTPRLQAFLQAYQKVRPLTAAERQGLNPMLRAAALRFWMSRLWDFHLPREASLLKPHDPTHFERVIGQRIHDPVTL